MISRSGRRKVITRFMRLLLSKEEKENTTHRYEISIFTSICPLLLSAWILFSPWVRIRNKIIIIIVIINVRSFFPIDVQLNGS